MIIKPTADEIAGVNKEVDIRKLQRQLGEDAWRLTPATMAHKVSEGEWQPARHLLYIAARIAAGIKRGNARIVVSMPPRHGKSELLSVWTSMWALDRDPTTEIILATYGKELSQDFSRKSRDMMIECQKGERNVVLNATIRADVQRVDSFQTTDGGGLRAVGLGGPITGRGADLFFVDDFLKNAKEAASPQLKQDIYDWFATVAMTRLSPTGSVIVLATRWNLTDLIGMIKAEELPGWEFIELPQYALENDPLGRELGEQLWKERFSKEQIEEIKTIQGEYFFQALHQQNPIPQAGGQITAEDFGIVDILPAQQNLEHIRSWDLASTEDGGDFTTGTLYAFDRSTGLNYFINRFKEKIGPVEVELQLAQHAKDDPLGTKIIIEQEPGSAGKIVVSHISRNVLPGYVVEGIRPTGDKFTRAQPLYAAIQAGNVKLLRGKWNKDFIQEHVLFPDVLNDDQVDTASQAFNRQHGKKYTGMSWGRKADKARTNHNAPTHTKALNKGGNVTGVTFGRNRGRKS